MLKCALLLVHYFAVYKNGIWLEISIKSKNTVTIFPATMLKREKIPNSATNRNYIFIFAVEVTYCQSVAEV